MAEGLRVLRAQLAAALASRGVTADRRVGVAVDPEVHRVVEVRVRRDSEREGVVVEVLRPGYAAGARLIREAEVVATGGIDEVGEAHRT
jgi:molecular chaperone GrpE (heat shock protein)